VTKAYVAATWDDAPHLTDAQKAEMWASIPPYQRDARSKGIPSVGAGAIYPVPLDDITCDDFVIPDHWPRGYGMDVGWKATAAIWGAWDRDGSKDCIYLYREYKRGQAEPPVHVAAIQSPGNRMSGAIDPASRGRGQRDGTKLIEDYIDLGLNLVPAKNAVEAGLFEVYHRLTTGRLKIMKSLAQTIQEIRLYRRDERGQIVKENDHLMDAMRYLILMANDVICWTLHRTTPTVIGSVRNQRGIAR